MASLEFLCISTLKRKEDFLQHITKLVQVELEVGDTYNNLFKKLPNEWNNETFINTAKDWIDFNTENQEDTSVFDQVIADESGLYAIFNYKE